MKSENRKTWLLLLLIVAVVGAALFFSLRKPKEKSFAELDREFNASMKVIAEKTELLDLIKEYQTLSEEIEGNKDTVKGK